MGVGLAAIIAAAAYRTRALTGSGAAMATVIGAATFWGGGLPASILLVLFFASGTLLTRLGRRRKSAAESGYAKSGRRDAGQVLANGGAAATLSLGAGLEGSTIWWFGIVGALAAVTADTWATELGGLSPHWPRRVTTGERVRPGSSGAVSQLGLVSAAAGAIFIGLASVGMGLGTKLGLAGAAGGFVGAWFDSLLGDTLQAMYVCPACGEETEQFPRHHCGTPTRRLRGWRWLDNDGVNFLTSAAGAVLAMVVSLLPRDA
jgi:uncharacterized protein (TIGR00297 family)